jgi:hypothetical protein
MSDDPNDTNGLVDADRRDVLRVGGGAAIGGIAAAALATSPRALAQNATGQNPRFRPKRGWN